ncbi:MAG: hypothetical protein A2Z49_00110 [Chloroflexi bacterium RBG_19FT_COMBO_56_12]|nr:MAG: hypothetical protein A2Z49_00110 [Chloroflexi bacterium RBG_19FT_COMBO_56_12]
MASLEVFDSASPEKGENHMDRRPPGLQLSIAYMDYKNLPGGRFFVVGVRSVKKDERMVF